MVLMTIVGNVFLNNIKFYFTKVSILPIKVNPSHMQKYFYKNSIDK